MRKRLADAIARVARWRHYDYDERRVRQLDRLEFLASIAAIVMMALMFLWVHNQGADLHRQGLHLHDEQVNLVKQRRLLASQELAQVETCRRLQIVRVEENISHYADFRVYRVVLDETVAAERQPLSAGLTAQERTATLRFRQRFVPPLAEAVQEKTWVPRTDCKRAVNVEGIRYRAPRPVRFIDRTPPWSALHVLPGDFQ